MGVLLRAKKEGIIPSVKEAVNKIQKNGFYIEESIYKLVLEQANE